MNFVENFFETIVKLLGSIANAIEQGVSAFVSRLQRIARELARFFVRMVRWAAKTIHSLWIIFLFFSAMFLALNCFMEMGYADYWPISWAGWILFALTLLLLVAALLRMASPSQYDAQQKHHMGLPLLLVNIALLAIIFGTLSYRPLRSPILSYMNGPANADQSRRGLLAAEPTPRPSVVPVNRKEVRVTPTNPVAPSQTLRRTIPGEEQSKPSEFLSCTGAASASYTPVTVLEETKASRPSNAGDMAGEVQVAGTVDREGKIHDLAVSSSSLAPEFGEEAIRAVSQWRFTPALWNGEPTDCKLKVTVAFEPKQP